MIVLDTHAWIWWAAGDRRLSARARRAIEGDDARGVSAVSCYETARLADRGRVQFDRDVETWIVDAMRQPGVVVLDVTPFVAMRAARLVRLHGDPFDRIIAATAIEHGAPLVTKDERLRRFAGLRTIW